METADYIKRLFRTYLNGEHTKEELDILLAYFSLEEESEQLVKLITSEFEKPLPDESDLHVIEGINERVGKRLVQHVRPKVRQFGFLRVAASIILLLAVLAAWFYNDVFRSDQRRNPEEQVADILPGGNRALLQLEGGETIVLSEDKQGIVTGQDLTYDDGTSIGVAMTSYATLITPKGGQYQVSLPDGSKVWLNAESSLRYPTHFNGSERKVELTGEAYFEIAHNKQQPFIVQAPNQLIQVLGTSFNITAYNNDSKVVTTLVTGSIVLHYTSANGETQTKSLIPGQQSTLQGSTLNVQQVDTGEFISWKDGIYMLNNVNLSQFAAQLERWYDVEFDIDSLQDIKISGILSRKANLSEILDAITEKENIKFKMEGRRISMKK